MARTFNASTANKLTRTDVLGLTAYPVTFAAWFNSASTTLNQSIISIGNSGNNNYYLGLWADGSASGDPVQLVSVYQGFSAARSGATTGYSANTWHHAAGVASGTTLESWLDGISGGTASDNPFPLGVDRTGVGILERSTPAIPFSGSIAWATVWNVALTDGEVKALAAGAHPYTVHPESIVAFWPLTGASAGDEPDSMGAYPLTKTGTVGTAESPLVFIGSPVFVSRDAGAVAADQFGSLLGRRGLTGGRLVA